MTLVTAPAVASPGMMILAVIVAVSAASAFLAWMIWRAWQSAERVARDPKYLRRRLFRLGLLYVGAAVFGIVEVATGREPIQTLAGLPIGLLFAWLVLRTATRNKDPSRLTCCVQSPTQTGLASPSLSVLRRHSHHHLHQPRDLPFVDLALRHVSIHAVDDN